MESEDTVTQSLIPPAAGDMLSGISREEKEAQSLKHGTLVDGELRESPAHLHTFRSRHEWNAAVGL